MRLRGLINGFEPYSWEPSTVQIAQETGLRPEQIKRFDTNTSPYAPTEWLRKLAAKITNIEVNQYPDTSYTKFRESLSKYTGTSLDSFVVTNGADEALDISAKVFLDAGTRGVISTPSYSFFRIAVELMGGQIVKVSRKNDFSDDVDKIIESASGNARIIFLCNPNNPTGTIIERDDLRRILEESGCAVVVDEAYHEFSGNTVADLTKNYENLIVVRTFSKAFSMAGVRVGYIIASEDTVIALNKVRPPNSLSTISLSLAELALDNVDLMKMWVREILEEKDRCVSFLSGLNGITPYPSKTNFVLIRFTEVDVAKVYQFLLARGLVVRTFSGEPSLKNFLRFSIGTKENNNSLLQSLSEFSRLN